MSDRYLFRGKRKDNGEWVYGDRITEPYGIVIQYYKDNKRIKAVVIPETIGQFTGLLDKNDVKIFEKDIIKFINGRLLDVRFNGETLQWELTDVGVPDCEVNHLCNTLPLAELTVEACYGEMTSEVVGNIYDNIELVNHCKKILKENNKC